MEIPDKIYERSVIEQLHLRGEGRRLFQKNAYSISINKDLNIATFSRFVRFTEENEIDLGNTVNSIRRQILCAGGELSYIGAEILFPSDFNEPCLRKFSNLLEDTASNLKIEIDRIAVFIDDARTDIGFIITGVGKLKEQEKAPWRKQRIFEGQDIVLTGNIGEFGLCSLFKKRNKEISKAFPKIFVERLKKEIPDRLPLVEVNTAQFYEVTSFIPCEKGFEAALWNLGDRNEAGFEVFEERFPYTQETIEIAELFNLNPLEMSSASVYLLTSFKGKELVHKLREKGLNAVAIGTVTKDKKRIIRFNDEERYIDFPKYRNSLYEL